MFKVRMLPQRSLQAKRGAPQNSCVTDLFSPSRLLFADGKTGRSQVGELFVLVLALCGAIGLSTGPISADTDLRIGVYQGNWPYIIIEDDQIGGIYVELAREAFERADIEIEFVPGPFSRLLRDMEDGRSGLLGFYHNEERALIFDYSQAFWHNDLVVFGHTDTVGDIRGPDDLIGQTVAVGRDFSYGEVVDQALALDDVQTFEVTGFDGAFRMLAAERVTLLFDTTYKGQLLIDRLDMADTVAEGEWILEGNDLHLAFARSQDRRAELEAFDRAIRDMRADGTYDEIVARVTSSLSVE